MIKKLMVALTLASAMGFSQAAVLLQEDFDDVSRLPGQGWILENASVPPGIAPGWVQGNTGVFDAHQGAPDAYIASSFQSAGPGGTLDDRLFTPLFSLENGAVATFWLRGASDPDPLFRDIVIYGYTGGAADPAAFIRSVEITAPTDQWTMYTVTIDAQAGMMARLGFVHGGVEATSNYVGLDTLRIDTLPPAEVPEPASLMILGIGMAGLTLARRRR